MEVEESLRRARCLSLRDAELVSRKQQQGTLPGFATHSSLRWSRVHCHFALPVLSSNLSGLLSRCSRSLSELMAGGAAAVVAAEEELVAAEDILETW